MTDHESTPAADHPGPVGVPAELDEALETELPWKDEQIKRLFTHVEGVNPLTQPF